MSWFSRMEKCVTLSTLEAEYFAIIDVVNGLIPMRVVWRFMLPEFRMP